jgi:hypothetical protein
MPQRVSLDGRVLSGRPSSDFTARMVTPLPETLCVMVALPPRHRAPVPLVTEMLVEGQHGAQPVMSSWG